MEVNTGAFTAFTEQVTALEAEMAGLRHMLTGGNKAVLGNLLELGRAAGRHESYGCPHSGCPHEMAMIARAQVHAALALAAAVVDGPAVMRPEDRDEWDRATGRLGREP